MIPIKKRSVLKQTNRKILLNILRDSGEISVAKLSKKVNLSKPTILATINHYVKKGLILNLGKGNSTIEGGKKPNIYKFNANGGYAIGMIISSNKIVAVITNLKSEIIYKNLVKIKTNEKFDNVLSKIIDLYENLIDNTKIDRKRIVGLAIGAYGITNFIKGEVIFSPHFPSWGKNVNLRGKILERIPDKIPVFVDNNSRFQVFIEKILSEGNRESNIVTIQAGKGLVAGVIIENEIKRGNNFLIGEIGHMVIDAEGREVCACGGKGCFEAMVSIYRILKMAREKYKNYPSSIIFNENNPDTIDIINVFNASNRGDELACIIMDDIIKWFAIGMSNIILMYDPQTIIIRGIFIKAGKYFLDNLREKINKISLFSIKRKTKINYSEINDDGGVLGAASYVLSKYFN